MFARICTRRSEGFTRFFRRRLHSGSQFVARPIEVVRSLHDGLGGIIATRRIPAGEVIHTAKPLVSHPSIHSVHDVCYHCLKSLREPAKTVGFCSPNCEQDSRAYYDFEKTLDWLRLEQYCLAKNIYYPLIVRRLICQVVGDSLSPYVFDTLTLPSDIPSPDEKIMRNEITMIMTTIERPLTGWGELDRIAHITEEWYIDAAQRILMNAFPIRLAAGSVVGYGVYGAASFYYHSDRPNVSIEWAEGEGVRAKVKAMGEIQKDEELVIRKIRNSR